MVAPFKAYAVDEAGDTKHRSCKTTIIVHGDSTMKWSDQPFDELVMDDIAGIPSDSELIDDMLCLQLGPCVAVLVSGTNLTVQDELKLIGSDKTGEIVHQIKNDMFKSGSGIELEIVQRKYIAI